MVINVRKEFEKREAAKPSTPKPPVQTSTANQRESRVSAPAPAQTFTYGLGSPQQTTITKPGQTLPTTVTKPSGGGKKVQDIKPKDTEPKVSEPKKEIVAGGGEDVVSGRTVVRSVTNEDGTVTIFYSDGTSETFGTPTKTPAKKEIVPNVAYDTIQKILESYRITGLASVLETIRDEYPEISSTELITLLQFDPRYNAKFNERFAGNVARQKAGKPVLAPSEYLKLEQAYEKIFNSYKLPAFKTQAYYDSFIVADIDPPEVTERVQLAYDRVLGDIPVKTAFQKFYTALEFSDIVAAMLDPVNQLPALQQKVKAAEIGGAAIRQGLTASELATTPEATTGFTNVTTATLGADVLARQGLTKAEAEAGYKDIAQILPTAEKLSSIYGGTEQQYGRLEAEQERLQGLASAQRKRQRLTELEMAQFKKGSGLGKGALKATPII